MQTPASPVLSTPPKTQAERLAAALAALNDDQRAAVEHGVGAAVGADHRPLLVIAGAGSGKTSTLAHRVAHLIADGVDPQRLLLLTFSRRAAQEMERRAGQVLARVLGLKSERPPALPWAGTFHGIGARLLREYAAQIGLDENFTIHDRGDAEDLMGLVRHELGLSSTVNRFPRKGTCLSIYSRCVNTRAPLAAVLKDSFPWCAEWEAELKKLFGAYVEAKQQQNVLDYDDLLLYWAEMVAEPALAAHVGARFDHVLVDEYQDTNLLQAEILRAMKPDGRGVTVVGDDAQSIYSFRGATVRNILDFPSQFSQEARIVTLERNYRSTQPILDVSNRVIAQAAERHAKTLWTDKPSAGKPVLVLVPDEAGQARWVADKILAHREGGLALKSQAVLFRTSSHSAALELELARRNIPFVKFGGLKFLEASHVKDLLAVLRFAQNPRGRMAGFRVTQLIPGVGPATGTRLLDAMDQAADPAAAVRDFVPPSAAREQWADFAQAYAALRAPSLQWPADVEVAMQWYQPHLERLYEDTSGVRRADVEQLARLAAGYGSRERFLTELTLDPPEATSDRPGPPSLDEDYLILSTIHSAKGQEWNSVHVINVVDGCMPADVAQGAHELEEERRLLYVAMTRARDHLHLVMPQRFHITQQAARGDRHLYANRTRFITESDLAGFELQTWPPPPVLPPAVPPPAAVIDLRNRMRAAWR
ncbi:DNA helicase-2/ATP-dependent DNA helicase PcrA [Variovorax boronicumulans]|uniref:DNA 3'-5' helicase n=1 Tax=Variovorax boronicumulans TaxID=436515 RepID=A0AAW8DSI5_9BURK|nr:ATP-dependent helicase [Variovorax boronicumulans]MDP9876768.1 DNA helicase-2/ATP-dependent DNA helicase PcrA [Variovorax boronicumulans]MDP9922355.1 DNA helicase-2/ATP-dependent DNA helicase PcrA [Variovorax boronicumulans]